MQDLIQTITNITNGIQPVAPVLAGLVLVVIGLLWTFAKDPQKKEMYVGWMVNVGIGFGIVFLATSLVSWFGGRVVGF
ncbi:pilin [Virgibacillus ihumii]|uniref:pilin n=1 Tax=Virgibacillus ihumii TaxID=2686091 RepID=UPI00157C69F8|nr:pilin [Virgibacillus ihumii]